MKNLDKPDKNSTNKKPLILTTVFTVLAIAFTAVVKFVDVRPVALNDSPVGLASLNEPVRNLFSYDEQGINPTWDKITDLTAAAIFAVSAFFIILGFTQLIRHKSFKKVDRELKLLALFYVAIAVVYVFFEKVVIINSRPVLMNGILEPSYPSSHALFALTLAGSAMYFISHYLKLKFAALINPVIALLALVTAFGRLIAGVHWFTDVLGSIFISAFLVFALITAINHTIKKPSPEKKAESE